MINVYILGIGGKMGKALQEQISFSDIFELEKSVSDPIDIIVDFSSSEGLFKGLSLALELNVPFISGTTGLNDSHFESLKKASETIPVLHCVNFSYGLYLIKKFLTSVSSELDEFYIDIEESHHLSKKDIPSGTTLELLKLFSQKMPSTFETEKRTKKDLGIHSQRTPYFSCDHNISLSSEFEQITIKHSSKSRATYAKGALKAASWLINKESGFYTIEHVFNDLIFSNQSTVFSSV